jgi:hypothetical protein
LIIVQESADHLVIELLAPDRKRTLAKIVLPILGITLAAGWAIGLTHHPGWRILVPLALLTLTVVALGYGPLVWLRNRACISVDRTRVNSIHRPHAVFLETNTWVDTLAEIHVRKGPREILFGEIELCAKRSDSPEPWPMARGFWSLEEANAVADKLRSWLNVPAGTGPLPATAAEKRLGRPLLYLAATGMVATIGSLAITLATERKGESVVEVDLNAPSPSAELDAKKGEELRFYSDVEVRGASSNGLASMLSESTLAIRLVDPNGHARETQCAVYQGIAEYKVGSMGGAGLGGMPNSCRFQIEVGGLHRVEVRPTWQKGQPMRASVEVRRVQPD